MSWHRAGCENDRNHLEGASKPLDDEAVTLESKQLENAIVAIEGPVRVEEVRKKQQVEVDPNNQRLPHQVDKQGVSHQEPLTLSTSEIPDSLEWLSLEEQQGEVMAEQTLLEQLVAKLGLFNSFESALTLMNNELERTALDTPTWSGLATHVRNMYLFGTWEARQALSALFLENGEHQAATYIRHVGLFRSEQVIDTERV